MIGWEICLALQKTDLEKAKAMYVDWTLYRLPIPLLRGGVDETQNPPKVGLDGRQRPEKEQSCGWGEAEDKNNLEFTGIAIVLG